MTVSPDNEQTIGIPVICLRIVPSYCKNVLSMDIFKSFHAPLVITSFPFQKIFFTILLLAVIGPSVLQETSDDMDESEPIDVSYDNEGQDETDQQEYDQNCISSALICRSMPEGYNFTDVCLRECQCRNQMPACPRTMCDPQVSQWFLNDQKKFLAHCRRLREKLRDI